MAENTGRPALFDSAGHQNKLELLFKTLDTENYNLVVAAGKAATPPLKPIMVDYRRIFGHDSWRGGERRMMQWQDTEGLTPAPAYRSFELGRVEAPPYMKVWVPNEDTELCRRPLSPLSGKVYALRRLLATFDRASERRIVRRNPASPLNLGYRTEQQNETFWDFLRLIEEEDTALLRTVGYHPDACFEEEVWLEALARAEGSE
jgi:hypothetical protein